MAPTLPAMDQRLVEAAAQSFAELEALQQEVLRLMDKGDEVPSALRDRLLWAEVAHDEAQAALEWHLKDR